jgi:hypothetical protein
MKLVRTDSFFGGTQKVGCGQPLMQRNLAPLKKGSDRYGELFITVAAFYQTGPCALARDAIYLLGPAALRTDGAIGPTDTLKVFAGLVLIMEISCG